MDQQPGSGHMENSLSSVSNLSAYLPRAVMRSRTSPQSSVPASWDDAVRSTVLESRVWRPHSLHMAETTRLPGCWMCLRFGGANLCAASLGAPFDLLDVLVAPHYA
jgi:hypothetical protein